MAENETEKEKTAIVLLVDGSEEMEAVIVVDVLRRAGVRHPSAIDNPQSRGTPAAENKLSGICVRGSPVPFPSSFSTVEMRCGPAARRDRIGILFLNDAPKRSIIPLLWYPLGPSQKLSCEMSVTIFTISAEDL